MTAKLSEAPDASPLFFPHELSADGTPSIDRQEPFLKGQAMIHETDSLQAIGYAIVFTGRRYGELLCNGGEWKACIKNRVPANRPIGTAPSEWYCFTFLHLFTGHFIRDVVLLLLEMLLSKKKINSLTWRNNDVLYS